MMRVAGNIEVKIEKIIHETPNVKRFRLVPTDQSLLPPFTGGSHIETTIENNDQRFVRSYSLTSPPTERNFYEIAIQRDPHSRGGSVFWHEQAEIGQTLCISFPRNHFPLSSRGRHHAFYAAGIGITPFLTMIRDLPKEDTFELHYAARTKQSCAFYDYLQEHYPDQTTFYFSRVQNPQRLTTDIMATHRVGTHVYFCGPTPMVEEFRNAAKSIGYPVSAIHFELFGNNAHNLPKNPFIVELTESEQILEVSDKETLLETLLKAGIDAPHSCRIGGCGSCEVDVIEGEVDHRDVFLSVENKKTRKTILTCCSRAKSEKLTLKL